MLKIDSVDVKNNWISMTYRERSLNQIQVLVSDICSKNNIAKNIIDDAIFLYKKIIDHISNAVANTKMSNQIIIRGEYRLRIIAACVFKACEKNNPLDTKKISEMFNINEQKMLDTLEKYDEFFS